MIKGFLKQQKKLLVLLSLIIALFLLYFIFVLDKPFVLGNDQLFQYNIFYKEWIRLIKEFFKSGSLPMYSWNMYLGTDFYSAMGYYCTGDIFFPIICIFHSNIELALLIETILCIYISAILMNSLLFQINVKNELNSVFISIIYSIGGMASFYFGNYMFHRFYAFLPLLFIGLHRYFKDKKLITFIIATAILFLQNYYFMFPTLIFLLLYSTILEIKSKKSFKAISIDFINLLIPLIVGFLISAVITLPSMMYLLSNSRVGSNNYEGLFWPLNTYIGLFMSLVSLNPIETGFDIFQNVGQAHAYQFTLFVTIIPLISSIKYLFKKENRPELFLLIFLILAICIKPFSSIMHGFSNPSFRWMFVINFYILLTSAKGMEYIRTNNDKKIAAIYLMLYIFGFTLLFLFNYINASKIQHIYLLILSFLLAVILTYIYGKNKTIAILLSILEVFCFEAYYLELETNGLERYSESINYLEIQYDQSIDEDIAFRYNHSYKNNNPDSILNQNKSLDYGFMSTATYNSMTDSNIDVFNQLAKTNKDLDWALYVDDYYANTMLGVKYYIVYDEKELPSDGEFEYAYNLDYLKVYKNLNYKGFGYSATKVKYTSEFKDTSDFTNYILVDDDNIDISNYTNLAYSRLNVEEKCNNYFKANIELKEDNIVLIPIPNNSGWNIVVNGEYVEPISVNGGFIGLQLKAGYNEIVMNFMSPYFKQGCFMTVIGTVGLAIYVIQDKKKGGK